MYHTNVTHIRDSKTILFRREITTKLVTNIRYRSVKSWKALQGQKSKVKVVETPFKGTL